MITILFVDDEPALLEITRLFLERSGEMKVETARSALEALEKIKTRTYDAIVSDFEMPLMDGIVLLKILRAEGDQTPFIIFTGKGREHVAMDALNNRADFYLQKGDDPRSQFAELDRMIRQAIQRKIAEESLRGSDRLMVEIIGNLPDATFAIDKEGKVISWNREMEILTGVKAEDILGKTNQAYSVLFFGKPRPMLIDLVLSSGEDLARHSYTNIRSEGNSLVAETSEARRMGKPATLWMRATRINNPKGELIGAIESIRDISEIRSLERERALKEEKELEIGVLDRIFGKSANAWFKKGLDLYYKQGKFMDAIQCFDRVLELEPGQGICLKELGRYEEAIQCFDRVITLSPSNPEIYYFKGECLEKIGQSTGDFEYFEKALKCFDQVLTMDNKNVNAWNYRGVCLKELRRMDEAKKSFEHAQMILRLNLQKSYD
jgi:DNA-binding response OmpR family regulator